MKGAKKSYTGFQLASALFMVFALLWLTISAPFVTASQQAIAKQHKTLDHSNPVGGNEEEASNPFGNTTEEKKPSGNNSFSEEYLHDHHMDDHFFSVTAQHHKLENSGIYTAFHGEVIVPPPNVA